MSKRASSATQSKIRPGSAAFHKGAHFKVAGSKVYLRLCSNNTGFAHCIIRSINLHIYVAAGLYNIVIFFRQCKVYLKVTKLLYGSNHIGISYKSAYAYLP